MNRNYIRKTKCASLFTEIDYIPMVYFIKPIEDRIESFYCKVKEINTVSGIIVLFVYSEITHDFLFEIEISLNEISKYEQRYLNYDLNLILILRIGDFIEYKKNKFSIIEDLKIDVEPILRNKKYYKDLLDNKIKNLKNLYK